jgi:hypothetical protein
VEILSDCNSHRPTLVHGDPSRGRVRNPSHDVQSRRPMPGKPIQNKANSLFISSPSYVILMLLIFSPDVVSASRGI